MQNFSLINLGNTAFIDGNYDEAIKLYNQVLAADENSSLPLVNLANAYFTIKEYAKAIDYAKKTLAIDSSSQLALIVLGNSYLAVEQLEDSLFYLQEALKCDSTDIWLLNSLSQVYQKMGHYSSAIFSANKAIELSNCDDSQSINMGYLLYEIALEKGCDYVLPTAKKLLDSYPDNLILNHMCNSLLSTSGIKVAPAHFVRNIFDVFAPDFEKVLHGLKYAVPHLLSQQMAKFYQKTDSNLRILDAGCGTGLCGKFLQPYCSKGALIGVDISTQMLKQADEKNIYNQLIGVDLLSYFNGEKNKFDAIIAADVFTYFGELNNLFLQMSKSIVIGGRILFSITQNTLSEKDYHLHLSGRFLHSQSYVKQLLFNHGFLLEVFDDSILRQEGDQPVKGWIVVALKQ